MAPVCSQKTVKFYSLKISIYPAIMSKEQLSTFSINSQKQNLATFLINIFEIATQNP